MFYLKTYKLTQKVFIHFIHLLSEIEKMFWKAQIALELLEFGEKEKKMLIFRSFFFAFFGFLKCAQRKSA